MDDDRTWGSGILLEQFGDQALEGVRLAGAGTVGRQGHQGLEILFHRAGGHVEMASDPPHRPVLATGKPMNFVDVVNFQHGPLISRNGSSNRGVLLARSHKRRSRRLKWRENQHLAGSQVVVCKMHQVAPLVTESLSLAVPFHYPRVVRTIVLPIARVHRAPLARTVKTHLLVNRVGRSSLRDSRADVVAGRRVGYRRLAGDEREQAGRVAGNNGNGRSLIGWGLRIRMELILLRTQQKPKSPKKIGAY